MAVGSDYLWVLDARLDPEILCHTFNSCVATYNNGHCQFSPIKRQSRLQQTTFINVFIVFSQKIRLGVSNESSARQRQRIHVKNQALFSSKDKSKKLKCRLLQVLFGVLRFMYVNKHRFEYAKFQVHYAVSSHC